jgi:hypothetical protein
MQIWGEKRVRNGGNGDFPHLIGTDLKIFAPSSLSHRKAGREVIGGWTTGTLTG